MRLTTIIVCILDAIGWAFIAQKMLLSESDPATMGLDVMAGWAVTIIFLLTAVPAFVLALKRRAPKSALALALAFPVALGALVVALFLYLSYM